MSSTSSDNILFIPPPYCKTITPYDEDVFEEEVQLAKMDTLDPSKVLQLCEHLTDRTSKRLEVKVNKFLRSASESQMVFLINLLNISEEAVVQTIMDKILDNIITIPLSEEAIGNIVEYKDNSIKCAERLDPKIQTLINDIVPKDSAVTIIPLIAKEQKVKKPEKPIICPVYLVCFVNSPMENSFLTKLVNDSSRFFLTILLNTRECEEERKLKKQCQSLLSVARKLFSNLGDLSDLLKEIMSEARRLTNAERCSLFLLDPNHMHLVAKVFDGVSPAEKSTEVRIARDQGIAGHVAATGQILNIKNAYKHPLFFKGMDEATGFHTRNILCFPIRDEENIVGVAQLCNKVGGHFDYFDEQVANAFSIYCGISIMHSLVYKKIQDAQARSTLSNELMIYHMKVSDQDVADVVTCPCNHDQPNFEKFTFAPRKVIFREMPCYILRMFEDLKLIDHFRIRCETLTRFILYVKKGYRDLPYHNWNHAFCVAHFAYLCIKNFKLVENEYITKLEALAFLVSALCHDIDHRGTTNSFQQQSNSVLASLYSSEGSVMERHHLSQTLCILNTEGCNFLDSLNREDYIACLDLIKNMILATDLAMHYNIHSRQLGMAEEGYNKKSAQHHYFLCSLLMTCADLSDQTKDWGETKRVAQAIYTEFFAQGDLEKKMGQEPDDMMDREKASIPDHQLEFLKEVCICIFKILAMIFPAANSLVDAIARNIYCWEASKEIFEKLCVEEKTSYEVLISDELEEEIQKVIKTMKHKR